MNKIRTFLVSRPLVAKALGWGVKLFALGWLIRNIVGLIAIGPVLWTMVEAGGTWMAIYVAFCAVAGVALNVLLPTLAYRKIKAKLKAQ